jgi:hypothetical protein
LGLGIDWAWVVREPGRALESQGTATSSGSKSHPLIVCFIAGSVPYNWQGTNRNVFQMAVFHKPKRGNTEITLIEKLKKGEDKGQIACWLDR